MSALISIYLDAEKYKQAENGRGAAYNLILKIGYFYGGLPRLSIGKIGLQNLWPRTQIF